jgi:phospholipase/carboxylesterase
MRPLPVGMLLVTFGLTPLAGCGGGNPGPAGDPSAPLPTPVAKYRVIPPTAAAAKPVPPAPKPPLTLKTPADPAKLFNKTDLSAEGADDLLGLAGQAAARKNYKLAAQAQHWAVKKAGEGRYNLACYYALAKQPDAALYFLQEAAEKEGFDSTDAQRDADLAGLRRDPRFKQVVEYAQAVGEHAKLATPPASLLYMPAKFDAAQPTPVVLLLHGRGSNPDNFLGPETQKYADKLGVPVISVSGTDATGPKSFVWAVNVERDFQRLDAAVQKHAFEMKFQPQPGQFVAVGFSEGAQVGLEVALRHPELFAGAVAISPGAADQFAGFRPHPMLKKRHFVITVGSAEARGNILLAEHDKQQLTKLDIPAELVTVPNGGHALPPDFDTKFPEWVSMILAAAK